MKKEVDEQDNILRAKLLKEFVKLRDEYGKERTSRVFAEFIVFVLPDDRLIKKLCEKKQV